MGAAEDARHRRLKRRLNSLRVDLLNISRCLYRYFYRYGDRYRYWVVHMYRYSVDYDRSFMNVDVHLRFMNVYELYNSH